MKAPSGEEDKHLGPKKISGAARSGIHEDAGLKKARGERVILSYRKHA